MRTRIAISLLAMVLTSASVQAQRTTEATPTALELGVDATATIGLGGESFTQINIPSGSLRLGFPINERISIEPRGQLAISHASGSTVTVYAVEVGALYHLDDRANMRSGLYLRPAIGVQGFSGDGSQNNVFAGFGVGLKKPLVGQLGSRYEVAYYRNFNNGGSNELRLFAGLSWFTH